MKLDTLGEFGLIDSINIPDYAPDDVLVGRGDDCAVLPYDETYYQVVSCDLLIEDVHFIRSCITPRELGYKSVAVNLSDVAAMGGKPVHILLSLALPPDYTVKEWQGFYQGVDAICRRYGVNVIGGDTTSSKDRLAVNVTVIGLVEKQHLHLRSHAKPGDVLFVTGSLGGSRAGLELILRDGVHDGTESSFLSGLTETQKAHLHQCHCMPDPCCEEIAALNRIAGEHLHALNDISDGLLSECSEIAQASGAAILLRPELVPVNCACAALAGWLGADARAWALTGGEDYQLVGTMDASLAEEICVRYEAETGKKLSIIGFVEDGNGVYLLQDGLCSQVQERGYNHFKDSSKNSCESSLQPEEKGCEKGKPEAADEGEGSFEALFTEAVERLNRQEEQQRIYRHDWNNHLAALYGLLQCGETGQAMDYVREMIAAVPEMERKHYTNRTVLDILFQQKVKLAEQNDMDIAIHCEEGLLDFMSDYDLCTLLGNLLDNGLEHCGTGEERWLYLDIVRDKNGDSLIRMENSCQELPDVQNGKLITRKKDSHLHGKGIAQIQRIAGIYGGSFSWQYDAERKKFVTRCRFVNSS